MLFSIVGPILLACGLGAFAVPTPDPSPLSTPSKQSLEWAEASLPLPELRAAFTATIDWDLDNNHTVATHSGTRISIWGREGYWYDTEGRQFGEIVRATDDGIIPPGTNYLELRSYPHNSAMQRGPSTNKNALLEIYYVVKLDDGYWAYVKHTGGATLRKTQKGIVRVETESPKYNWLNEIDFAAPGVFNGSVMTVRHYFAHGTE
ncbi:hypothetical protein SLS55_010357 [Diplodia seriata]|uniref:Uncharacterized protein n=1 Tax=Diplodia seriata TaxID=420778 RepID=A0ABR3BZT5_9PEZI